MGFELNIAAAEGDTAFWHLGDAVRRTKTKAYLRITENPDPLEMPDVDETCLENLLTWIYGNPKTGQTKLIRSIRDIPQLDRCLGHPKSIAALEEGETIDAALEAAQAAGFTVVGHLDRAKKSVQRATGAVSDVKGKEGVEQVTQARQSLRDAVDAFDKAFDS